MKVVFLMQAYVWNDVYVFGAVHLGLVRNQSAALGTVR